MFWSLSFVCKFFFLSFCRLLLEVQLEDGRHAPRRQPPPCSSRSCRRQDIATALANALWHFKTGSFRPCLGEAFYNFPLCGLRRVTTPRGRYPPMSQCSSLPRRAEGNTCWAWSQVVMLYKRPKQDVVASNPVLSYTVWTSMNISSRVR